jgi:hypothetical protein
MTSSLEKSKSTVWLAASVCLVTLALAMTGCAGSKKSAGSEMSSSTQEASAPPANEKLDEAKRTAEEAEQKAHELRVEKAKGPTKPTAN